MQVLATGNGPREEVILSQQTLKLSPELSLITTEHKHSRALPIINGVYILPPASSSAKMAYVDFPCAQRTYHSPFQELLG
jgi:hypothetical protein